MPEPDTRTCPFCAEEIKLAAIVCKHCGRDVPPIKREAPPIKSARKRPAGTPEEHAEATRQMGLKVLGIAILAVEAPPHAWKRATELARWSQPDRGTRLKGRT